MASGSGPIGANADCRDAGHTGREPATGAVLALHSSARPKESAIMRNRTVRAFTLIEILIVVVILGILAAIVIPQFTDASEDAMNSSVRSQLQTVRSQIELYNVQHPDTPYDATTVVATFFDELVNNNYLQQEPRNPFMSDPAEQIAVGAAAAADVGWVWDGSDFFATDGLGALFDENGDGAPG
jgi:prepilin-type N-terminal cleavage/methylation domain-containing protein